jgi:LmbE family N-acetylglucosaminyl deacetylase
VTCVVATAGDLAEYETERRSIGRRRLSELGHALDILDVRDRELLHLPDGSCAELDPSGPVNSIARILDSRAADTVVTFGLDGLTGHPDHRAVARWTIAAVARAQRVSRVLHPTHTPESAAVDRDINERFPIFDAGLPSTHHDDELALTVDLDDRWLATKMRALRSHHSQTHQLIGAIGELRYRRWVSTERFVESPT